MTNGFALNHDKSLQIYFFCVQCQAKNHSERCQKHSSYSLITKINLYNFDPLKVHFYIKLGFTGVYTIFLISDQKHRLWVLVRTASMRHSNEYP